MNDRIEICDINQAFVEKSYQPLRSYAYVAGDMTEQVIRYCQDHGLDQN